MLASRVSSEQEAHVGQSYDVCAGSTVSLSQLADTLSAVRMLPLVTLAAILLND